MRGIIILTAVAVSALSTTAFAQKGPKPLAGGNSTGDSVGGVSSFGGNSARSTSSAGGIAYSGGGFPSMGGASKHGGDHHPHGFPSMGGLL